VNPSTGLTVYELQIKHKARNNFLKKVILEENYLKD
jgi:hypothetical protein